MDAIKFINETVRMCSFITNKCTGCPLHEFNGCNLDDLVGYGNVEQVVKIVEKWSKEHPRKTRQSLFLEQNPEANVGSDGVLQICPCLITASYRANGSRCTSKYQCSDCRKNFWSQEIENNCNKN